jgi:hypothetical protein
MLKKAENFFISHTPFAWEMYTQDLRDSLLITYFNLGELRLKNNMDSRFSEYMDSRFSA